MSVATVRPMPKPAMRGASGDTAVPYTAHTRKIVSSASTPMPIGTLTPFASAARLCSLITPPSLVVGYCPRVADFRPVEAVKARILNIRAAQATTTIEDANAEWIEVQAALDSDLANWRLQHLRALWREEIRKPVEWEWVYTWGSPSFVRAGEIYRIHSGSRVRAATHPLADDLVGGRKHVYAAGPIAAARLLRTRGDYARLVDAFGTVIDEIVVWPPESAPQKAEQPASPR